MRKSAMVIIFVLFTVINVEASPWHFLSIDNYIDGLMSNNLDIKNLEHEINAQYNERKQIKSQFMPHINLELDYNKNMQNNMYQISSVVNWNIPTDHNHISLANIEIDIKKIRARKAINELISDLILNYSKLTILIDTKDAFEQILSNINHISYIIRERYLVDQESFSKTVYIDIEREEISNKIEQLDFQIYDLKTKILNLTGIEAKETFKKISVSKIEDKILEKFNISLSSKLNDLEEKKAILELNSSMIKPDINLYAKGYVNSCNLEELITDDIKYEYGAKISFNLFDSGNRQSCKHQKMKKLMQIRNERIKQQQNLDYERAVKTKLFLFNKHKIISKKIELLDQKINNALMVFKSGYYSIEDYLEILNEKQDQKINQLQVLMEIIENILNYYSKFLYEI